MRTVNAFLREWLEAHTVGVRPLTARNYRSAVTNYIAPVIGEKELSDVTPGDIAAIVRDGQRRGLSAGTIRHTQVVLRMAFGAAVEWGYLTKNVAKHVDTVTVPTPPIKLTTVADARQVLQAMKGRTYEPVILLIASLGLRRGEACALRWDDVDLDRGTISIKRSVQRVTGRGLVVTEPKTAAGVRTLPLPAVAHGTLVRLRAATAVAEGYIFTGPNGGPLDSMCVYNDFQDALASAGLPAMGLHQLRHAYGTLLRSQGVSEKTLMELLGHTSIRMTTRYGAVVDDLKVKAAAQFDAALGG